MPNGEFNEILKRAIAWLPRPFDIDIQRVARQVDLSRRRLAGRPLPERELLAKGGLAAPFGFS